MESARGVIHAELHHLLPRSYFVLESLCVTASCRGGRPCLALRGYYRPGEREHRGQRALDRNRCRLELVSVVCCRDGPPATSATLVRKYRAVFAVSPH